MIFVSDQFDYAAAEMMGHLTQDKLAKLLRGTDELLAKIDSEHRYRVRLVSALLELTGGQAYIPGHALKDTPGYETAPGEHAGDLLLRLL